ncbi:hypothetical protein N0V84_005345 [Fusarium piperis]|uniref:Uncharacterized protein n=1 Tax=Fusarium piperis TaxID=1435070 RepID=A0A9W8WDX3_9HYPO|nr:hypothetical protein N0V84_005345 [Fusarium piperis]
MAEIPTPTPSSDPFSVGAPKRTLDVEECTVISFYFQMCPRGEWVRHNLIFDASWSGRGAPKNILFLETKDGKPWALNLPHPLEGTPKNHYTFSPAMKFYGPRRQRPEPEPHRPEPGQENEPRRHADAGRRPWRFQASINRARGMFGGIRRPAFEVPPGRWWQEKIGVLLGVFVMLMMIFFAFQAVSHAPQVRDIIRSKLALVNQEGNHTDHFNTDKDFFKSRRDYVNTNKEQVKTEKRNSKADKDHVKAAKDNSNAKKHNSKTKDSIKTDNGHSKANKDHAKTTEDNSETRGGTIKTDKGEFKFDRNADGTHIRGTWTEPNDTHVTFKASKTSGGEPPVTEIKFMRSEEQFIKDDNNTILFSLNRITRFLVTLIGGEGHDEKLDKVSEFT